MSALDGVTLTRTLAHRRALREFADVPKSRRRDIVDACKDAAELDHPIEHPKVRKVDGSPELYRLRSGDYRAIVDYRSGRVRILRVGHRSEVYESGSLEKAMRRHNER